MKIAKYKEVTIFLDLQKLPRSNYIKVHVDTVDVQIIMKTTSLGTLHTKPDPLPQ